MQNKQLIIYGAGVRGKAYYDFFMEKGLQDCIYGFCDKKYAEIVNVKDKKVYSYEEVKDLDLPFLITMVDGNAADEVGEKLKQDGNRGCLIGDFAELFGHKDDVEFNREICAFFHTEAMNDYFRSAEGDLSLNKFWGAESKFRQLFEQLDLTNVIELACGRGRHVPQYIDRAGAVTLVDILQENMDFCENRFKEYSNISYYCNNGYNLEKLENEKYSSLFTYDAMVHFEMKDIYRVLVHGGKVLIHHSNNHSDYKASFANAPGGRGFMSKDIFAHLAHRSGFEIVEQQVIDWGVKDLDCITLLEKK